MSKKGAKITKEVSRYEVGDVVLGKVRGYPPWPAVVSASKVALKTWTKWLIFFSFSF
jgi:hypothetical protein